MTSPSGRHPYPAEVMTPGEVQALIAACSSKSRTGIRNRALLTLLYRSGLRISEVVGDRKRGIPPLKPTDVDLDKHTIRVLHGKGDKATTRGFHPSATDALARWLDVRRQLGLNGRPPLFCTLAGKPLYAQYVRALLGRLAEKAGIEKRVHPHGFRHTFAVELEMAGTPVTVISKLLGHFSTAVTARYLDHLTNAQAVAVLEGVSLPSLED